MDLFFVNTAVCKLQRTRKCNKVPWRAEYVTEDKWDAAQQGAQQRQQSWIRFHITVPCLRAIRLRQLWAAYSMFKSSSQRSTVWGLRREYDSNRENLLLRTDCKHTSGSSVWSFNTTRFEAFVKEATVPLEPRKPGRLSRGPYKLVSEQLRMCLVSSVFSASRYFSRLYEVSMFKDKKLISLSWKNIIRNSVRELSFCDLKSYYTQRPSLSQ